MTGRTPGRGFDLFGKARLDDAELAYVAEGEGTPVVFVHAVPADYRQWEPQRAAVAARYRFVAYSHRYHYPNPWAGDGSDYSNGRHAGDLVSFLRALAVGPVHLVGLSNGGLVAALAALGAPEFIRSLVLAEASIGSLIADLPEGQAFLAERAGMVGRVRAAAEVGEHERALALMLDYARGEPGSLARLPGWFSDTLRANARTLGLLAAAPPPPPITRAQVQAFDRSLLIMRGARSPRFYGFVNETLAREKPGSEVVTIPNASHFTNVENPAAFNEALLGFLARQ